MKQETVLYADFCYLTKPYAFLLDTQTKHSTIIDRLQNNVIYENDYLQLQCQTTHSQSINKMA